MFRRDGGDGGLKQGRWIHQPRLHKFIHDVSAAGCWKCLGKKAILEQDGKHVREVRNGMCMYIIMYVYIYIYTYNYTYAYCTYEYIYNYTYAYCTYEQYKL